MKKTDFHKLNKGMTLVELLVTIAIIAVVTTVSIVGIGLVTSGDSKKASKSVRDVLNEVRTDTLSKDGEWKASISNDGGTYYANIYEADTLADEVKLGSRIDITYGVNEGTNEIAEGYELVFCYKRGSGNIESVTYRKIGDADGTDAMGEKKMTISVDSSSKGEYILELWYSTGKITGQE